MLRCGKQIRLTKEEAASLAIEGVCPTIKTMDDYIRAHETKIEYFSGDTVQEKLLRDILEDDLWRVKALSDEAGWNGKA